VRLQEVENNREHLFGSLQTGYNPKVQYQALKTANWQQELPVKLRCFSIASKMDARTSFKLYDKDQEMPRKVPFAFTDTTTTVNNFSKDVVKQATKKTRKA
jgi:hypothetical protein